MRHSLPWDRLLGLLGLLAGLRTSCVQFITSSVHVSIWITHACCSSRPSMGFFF